MPPSCSSPRQIWGNGGRWVLLCGLWLAMALPASVRAEPEERPRHRWDLGVDLIGLWGVAVRAGWEHDDGAVDMLGLKIGYATGPSPVFGSERNLGSLFVAPTIDLFAEEEWQLELTAGVAAVDRDTRGKATYAFDDIWGVVAGIAGRYKTPGWFQINIGVMLLGDRRLYERVVVVDIGPSIVW